MAMKKGTFSVSCTIALVLSIAVIADAQTFFQNGRFGKRSDLRLRGKTQCLEPHIFVTYESNKLSSGFSSRNNL